MSDKKYTAHVVSHTHWDREWYRTFQRFRMRLVEMTDYLIDLMESDPDYTYFVFDGQTIVLEDYLEIRPENEKRLRSLIEQGRILIGPWYNQPDEFLVSGESIVRNLLRGKQMCDDYGNYMAVGHVPDAFGHISQLPQILLGFGIDSAVLLRGITTDQVDAEFNWRGSDGSEVLAVKLPDNNSYSNFLYRLLDTLKHDDKPIDEDQTLGELKALLQDCIDERPTTSQLLFMDGVDHIFPQYKTPEIIKLANEKMDDLQLVHSTLPDFVEAVKSEKPELKTYTGELRWSNRKWRLQSVLAHVMSSRMHLKQANHASETLLEKYVEPLCSWAWALGAEYPKSYIDLAWKYLLQNSPHDSICGCSIDQVHKEMVYRFEQATQICEPLVKKSMSFITDKIGSTADNPDHMVLAAVFNTLGYKRSEVVEADVYIPNEWHLGGLKVTNPDGEEVPSALLKTSTPWLIDQTRHDIPQGPSLRRCRMAIAVKDVPSVGYKAYRVEVTDKPNRQPATMLLGPDTAENEYLAVTVSSDGTLYILDKQTDAAYTTCLIFEDGADVGDGYNYIKPMNDKVVTSLGAKCRVSIAENNAVRVVFEIETDLELPASIDSTREGRLDENVICKVKTFVTLAAGSKRVDFKTIIDNQAKDHRLRVLFPTGIPATVSHAEQAFDVVERSISVPVCADWKEPLPTTHPQKSFVDISGGGVGFTLINKGLPEYEVRDDEARTIALTLLRATGSGVGGAELQTDAQMIGEHTFEYAIYPHSGDWEEAKSWVQAHEFNEPLIIGQTGVHDGDLPMEKSFIENNDDRFILSAIKKAESDDALILRGFNTGSNSLDVNLGVDCARKAEKTDLSEKSTGEADLSKGVISAKVASKQIVSFKIDI
ncbi:MAG: glycoside hydrolase family 38 C-terminal domain-containing protein [Armatimonadota bacterium]